MADKYRWGVVTMLPDGHRLFPEIRALDKGVRIAITDNSAREPQDSLDGILWLDFDWNLMITSPDNVLCIPIKRDNDDERFSTITDMSTMLYLSEEFNWPIEDQNTRDNILYSVTKEGK